MDHTYQSTMLMPASYAVLSEEEMTYLDGGADYSFNVGDYTVTLHPEVLVTYAMNVVVNGVYMLSQGSFQYFINTFKEGLSDGLSLTGVVKHNWNRMNTWSRVATVGMAGLAGYYAYAQVRSMYLSLKNLFGSMFGTTTNTDTQDPSVAAGLAAMGYVPFVSSFAMFAAGRAFEQVRNSVGYPHLNVKIGATHGGISVGEDGASHQCCEDFALMRSIPGMTVICPADDIEARAAVRAAYAMEGPVYLRFGRLAVPVFHDEANYHFELGKGEQLTEGNDIAIIATGLMVNEARMAAEQLAAEGIHARVINIHTIKPLDEEIVLKAAKECGKVITAEEHNIIGGLGEAVCAVLSEKLPTPVRRVGVQDVFGCSGPAWDLLKKFGLDAATICKTAHEMLGK